MYEAAAGETKHTFLWKTFSIDRIPFKIIMKNTQYMYKSCLRWLCYNLRRVEG